MLQGLLLPRVLKSPGAGELCSACPSTNLPTQGAGQGGGRGWTGLAMRWPYQLCQDRQKDDNSGSVAGKLREQGDDRRDEDDGHGWWHTLQGMQTASYPHRQARLLQKGRAKTGVILLHPCRGTDPLLELVLRVSHSKQLARSCNLLSYLLCIAVTWSWEMCPLSVRTPLIQVFQSQMRTPSDTLIKPNPVGQDDATWHLLWASPHSPWPWQSPLQAAGWCSRAPSLGPSSKSARAGSLCLVLETEQRPVSNTHPKRSISHRLTERYHESDSSAEAHWPWVADQIHTWSVLS